MASQLPRSEKMAIAFLSPQISDDRIADTRNVADRLSSTTAFLADTTEASTWYGLHNHSRSARASNRENLREYCPSRTSAAPSPDSNVCLEDFQSGPEQPHVAKATPRRKIRARRERLSTHCRASNASSHTPASSASLRSDGSQSGPRTRELRSPRPLYSESQKFFILHARIIQEKSWPEIEDRFAAIWGQRTKGGLTSVYYRIRQNLGMREVLQAGSDRFGSDRTTVEEKAKHFPTEFLETIGYFDVERI